MKFDFRHKLTSPIDMPLYWLVKRLPLIQKVPRRESGLKSFFGKTHILNSFLNVSDGLVKRVKFTKRNPYSSYCYLSYVVGSYNFRMRALDYDYIRFQMPARIAYTWRLGDGVVSYLL